jgi:HEPN domain-containing protein
MRVELSMSTEKNITESTRWFSTAEDDFHSAKILRDNGQFAHSCSHSQQAGEKALKAVWYFIDADPWGHSIKKLIDDLCQVDTHTYNSIKMMARDGLVLDRFYIPTRYPNGLPDITPNVAFTKEDADNCIAFADNILNAVKAILKL